MCTVWRELEERFRGWGSELWGWRFGCFRSDARARPPYSVELGKSADDLVEMLQRAAIPGGHPVCPDEVWNCTFGADHDLDLDVLVLYT